MKLKSTKLILLALIITAAISCQQENGGSQQGSGDAVRFSGGITSRANDTGWDSGDRIGLTMIESGSATVVGTVANYPYYTDDNSIRGVFHPSEDNRTIYFPQDGTEVRFRGYYPYSGNLPASLVYPINVGTQTNLPAIDLMTSEETTTYSKGASQVELKFHHRLSKLIFNIKMQDGQPNIDITQLKMTVNGMYINGTYDLLSTATDFAMGNITAVDVPHDAATGGVNNTRMAIVMPRPAGAGVTFVFTTPDGTGVYTAIMDPTLELKSEYKYTFDITLQNTPVTVGATVEDWLPGGTSYPNALKVSVPPLPNVNVTADMTMDVFMENGSAYESLITFTSAADASNPGQFVWNTPTPIYWEDITPNPAKLRASILLADAPAGSNQLPDMLLADDLSVQHNVGASFVFRHAASKVTVQLLSSDESFTPAQLQAMDIVLPQYITGGSFANGSFTAGNTPADITVTKTNTTTGVNASALIQDQTIDANITLVRVTDPQTSEIYNLSIPSDIRFRAGEARLIKIDMKRTPVLVSANVIDWTKAGEVDITSTPISVTGGLLENDTFFRGKAFRMYKLGADFQTITYTYQDNAGTYKWQGDQLYWDDQSYPLNLTAIYYPDENAIPTGLNDANRTFRVTLNLDQTTGYAPQDLLSATLSLNMPTAANFQFNHIMSKVVVKITAIGFETSELSGMQVSLPNFKMNGTVSLTDGKVTTNDLSVAPLVLPWADRDAAYQYSALVMPQTIPLGQEVVRVKLPAYDTPFSGADTAKALQFMAGQQTVINLTLKKTGIGLAATLEPWSDGDEGNVIIQ